MDDQRDVEEQFKGGEMLQKTHDHSYIVTMIS